MKWILWSLAVLGGLFGLHRLALWAERRGWIYYRKHGSAGAIANAMLEAQAMLESDGRRALEERTRQHVQTDPSGEPPVPGRDP